MNNKIKRLMISILGLLQGAIGSFFAMVGLAFAFPETEPGSMDYEENMSFIPLGIFLMIAWLAVMIYAVIRLRKSKNDLLSFMLCWVIGTGGFLLYIFFIR